MKPQAAAGNAMQNWRQPPQVAQAPPDQSKFLGGLGNIGDLIQKFRMGRADMPQNQMRGAAPFQNASLPTLPTQMPFGNMGGGMNPYSAKLMQGGINPAEMNTVTSRLRPTEMSDISPQAPALKFSNPNLAGRMNAIGPQVPTATKGATRRNSGRRM